MPPTSISTSYLRGAILHFRADPGEDGDPAAWQYLDDGALRIVDGKVAALGPAAEILAARKPDDAIHDHRGKLRDDIRLSRGRVISALYSARLHRQP